jgi:hypothetical protein
MEKEKIEAAFDNFLGTEEPKNEEVTNSVETKKIIKKSDGIIEHVEKKLVVEDGRELLL